MPTYTPNYNFIKPDRGNVGDWDNQLNYDLDQIDIQIKNRAMEIANLDSRVTINEQNIQTNINELQNRLKLDGSNSPTADIDFAGFRIKNAADPVDPQDYVTKKYADDLYMTLDKPVLLGDSQILENTTTTNTITNYNSAYTYTVSFSDPLVTGYISGDTIYITAGDISDNQDHIVQMSVTVSYTGYYPATTTKDLTIVYFDPISDDAILLEAATYTDSNFDEISGGAII